MKRLPPVKDVSIALSAGQLDLRSPSGRTQEGAFRLIVNAIGDSRGQLRRLGGWRRLALSEPMTDMTFAVISDYGVGNANELAVSNLVKSWNPEFIVTAGDNVYGVSPAITADSTIVFSDTTTYTADYLNSLESANQVFNNVVVGYYGDYLTSNSFYPTIGNHDVDFDGTAIGGPKWFRSKFPHLFQNNTKNYYTFQRGDVGFFIVSSGYRTNGTVFEPDGNNSVSVQANWLRAQLAASKARVKVVVFHHPPFSSTSGYSFINLNWDFYGWGADVVINGHAHNYQRWLDKPSSSTPLPYIVAGIGGANLYNFNQSTTGSVVDNPPRFGALRCTVHGHELKIEAIAVGGAIIDSIVICTAMNEDLHDQLPDFPDVASVSLTSPTVYVVNPVVVASSEVSVAITVFSAIAITAPEVEATSFPTMVSPTISVVAPTVTATGS